MLINQAVETQKQKAGCQKRMCFAQGHRYMCVQHPDIPIPTWTGDDYGYYGNFSGNFTCILHVINSDKQLVF